MIPLIACVLMVMAAVGCIILAVMWPTVRLSLSLSAAAFALIGLNFYILHVERAS